jgi:hypothetical protein
MEFRKTGYVLDEFCDQPIAQVDPILPVTGVSCQQACGASLSVFMLETG